MTIAALVGAAMAWQPQAPASIGSQALDAQCLLVMSAAAEVAGEAHRAPLQLASIFFGGRMSARVPGDGLEEVLWEQARLMAGVDQQALIRRCGELMTLAGAKIAEAGKGIATREQAPTKR